MREFYSNLPRPVRVGIEATGSMQWFVNLMEELGIESALRAAMKWGKFLPHFWDKSIAVPAILD